MSNERNVPAEDKHLRQQESQPPPAHSLITEQPAISHHATTEQIPSLVSAPPSLIFSTATTTLFTQPLLADPSLPPPPPIQSDASGPTTDTTTSTLVLSLPPPPRRSAPPLPVSPLGALLQPTIATLPVIALLQPTDVQPPPLHHANIVSPPPVQQQQNSSARYNTTPLPPTAAAAQATATATSPVPPPTSKIPTSPPPRLFLSPLARRQTHIPILILTTESADKLAHKNNLSLPNLLLGLSNDLGTVTKAMPLPPFRSSTRSIILEWDSLHVSFVDNDSLTPQAQNVANQKIFSAATVHECDGNIVEELDMLESQVDSLLKDTPVNVHDDLMDTNRNRQTQYEQVTKDAYSLTSPPNLPWLLRVRHELDVSTNGLPHDLLVTPALCLLVCTTQETTEVSILECLNELSNNPHYLPAPYFNGMLDVKGLRKEALVLHDNVDGPPEFNEQNLIIQLRKQFGVGSALVRINSIAPVTALAISEVESIDEWGGSGDRGGCLSANDRLSLRRYIATMIAGSLLPSLERRISNLNMVVNEKKKGVKNVLKNFWQIKPTIIKGAPNISGKTDNSVAYRHDAIESQVRLLADTLFLMRDYDAALGTYKLIREDYKNDQAMLHYASIHEMMGICSYLLDPIGRSRETFSALESSLQSYTRAAEDKRGGKKPPGRPTEVPFGTRLATRLCLVLSSTRNMCADRHLEVADMLASMSSHETSLGAAVMLEQSSSHYYRAGMFRKYAFHMLMSGHMFRSAGQEQHAFRCFTSALYVYHDGQWDQLHNHLRSALAAQLYSLGRKTVSFELYAKLVGTTGGGRVSVKSQEKFVNHLLEICNDHSSDAMVGADRMMTGKGTHALTTKERARKMEQVLQSTPGAKRVLELPAMDLPRVVDSSISISIEREQKEGGDPNASSAPLLFGTFNEGSDSTWQELTCSVEAELRAAQSDFRRSSEKSMMGPAIESSLENIDDAFTRHVLSEIDNEKMNLKMMQNSKKNGNYKESKAVRARMEPLAVSFQMENPLGVKIEMIDMQLVARIKEEESGRICTSEDAIVVAASERSQPGKIWTFKSSNYKFEAPHFCRTSPDDGSDPSDNSTKPWKSVDEEEPYFVVTKSEMALEPGMLAIVSLSICPLVRGDLEVVGVRFNLFEKVWVYHEFRVLGPLLNHTRINRANRDRGEALLLKAKVEEDMPYLTAEIVTTGSASQAEVGGSEDFVLEGQISSWILRLSNIGAAAASNVMLKTNFPWFNIQKSEMTSAVNDRTATSNCVGPTGTLLELPIKGGREQGVIHTGETIDIPIYLRIAGSGKQEFYMLYRYELFDPSLSLKRCRWLRRMVDVPVYPSLTLSASLVPSFLKDKEHILSVEMTNQRSDQPVNLEITLYNISVTSRHYRLERMLGQLGEVGDEPLSLQIGWQERVIMHYKVVPRDTDSSACAVTECPFTEGNSYDSITGVRNMTSIDYLCLEHAHCKFQASLKTHQNEALKLAANEDDDNPRSIQEVRRAKTAVSGDCTNFDDIYEDDVDNALSKNFPDVHPTSLTSLCPPQTSLSEIGIISSWSANRGGAQEQLIYGQHHLTHLSVRPQTKIEGCPVTLTAKHPTKVSHNFFTGPVTVPLEVTIRNRVIGKSVTFDFEIERPKTFEFTGVDSFKWSLEGGDEVIVLLQAVVSSSGMCNLQNVLLTVDTDGNKVPYMFPLQWMLLVEEASTL